MSRLDCLEKSIGQHEPDRLFGSEPKLLFAKACRNESCVPNPKVGLLGLATTKIADHILTDVLHDTEKS